LGTLENQETRALLQEVFKDLGFAPLKEINFGGMVQTGGPEGEDMFWESFYGNRSQVPKHK